jgi:Prokaryotic Cytochrome C oxidase subunit IV/Polyphosphate kinase 2 (PPK2)
MQAFGRYRLLPTIRPRNEALHLALVLTITSFWVANTSVLWTPGVPAGLAVLAIAQMGVHLVFFLHITTGPDNTNNILALAFGVLHRIPGARRVARDHGQLEREYGGTHRANEFAYAALTEGHDLTRERPVVVLEGWDTAGEGGIVRRLGWALDPRRFKVRPIAAPSS